MKAIKRFRYLVLLIFAYCSPAPKVAGQFTEKSFDKMANKMAKGSVPDLSVLELKEQLNDVILLDTREYNEFEISHLPNAIWVGYDDFDLSRVESLAKDKTIVTYCSVGYRSERIGEKLMSAGYENVFNLKGSLFKWANEGNPIVDVKGQPTQKIHGYNEKWAKWIKNGEIVY